MRSTVKSPTRVDLAGGTLDCWPLYLMVGQAITTNVSINIWTSATLEPLSTPEIEIDVRDLKFAKRFSDIDALLRSKEPELDLIRAHVAHWKPERGFRLATASQSPVGGGLGGSSSLCISLIKVFSSWLSVELSQQEMVTLASNLEAQILRKPTGTQDYFGALSRGLNAIHYGPNGPRLERLPVDEIYLSHHLTLVYTGRPHHSGLNNWSVLKQAMDGDKKTLAALQSIKVIADEMYEQCRAGRWNALPELFRREFAARTELSAGFSSPEIVRLEELVLKAGADAVKICGAGGGGCVLVWSAPERKLKVEDVCRKAGFEVLDAAIAVEP